MSNLILHPSGEAVDLTAADIPWGRGGLSRYVVEDRADVETYRLMAREALTMAARLTVRCRQYEVVVGQLRDELRARRAA